MAQVTFKGNPVQTVGTLPKVGDNLPSFALIKTDLSEITEKDFSGKKLILNIAPSIDTGVCSKSMVEFNKKIAADSNTAVVGVTMDLPFAIARHGTEHQLDNIIGASGFRSNFGTAYGVKISGGPLEGVFARAVVVADGTGKVIYTELVPEITAEPDYDKALAAG